MGQSYKIVTTNLGRTAVRFALAQGTSVKLTHMAVGDGGGQDVEPVSSMTGLVHETFRAQINEITLDAAYPDMFTAELFIPQSVGGFYIREVGLFMEDGTLFAVGSMPLTEKPDLGSGSASDLLIKIIVRVLDASTISISIDPAQVLATRDYVDRMDRDRIRAAVEAHNTEQAAHDYLARKSVQIKAGTGLTGGGTLEKDLTLGVTYGTVAGTACQGNDARVTAFEAFRLSIIGVPLPWPSTTLDEYHVWADGGLNLFEDWPELKKKYESGGFAGMLLPWDADEETIAANLGKWRPDSANPTGLYAPSYGGQFSRAWVPGSSEAGGYNAPGLPNIAGWIDSHNSAFTTGASQATGAFYLDELQRERTAAPASFDSYKRMGFSAQKSNAIYGSSTTVMPPSIDVPRAIYLGVTA